MSEYYYEERPNRFYCKKYLINRSACTTLLDEHEVCERLNNLERKLKEAREIHNQLAKWVHEYAHCMRTVDYCGSLEDANEMDQYLSKLKEQG